MSQPRPPRRIAFICAPTCGPWTPEAADGGIGGSEEAVINMAASLARLGHHVGVYMRDGVDRRFGGVFYGSLESLPGEHIDVAVVWRRPSRVAELDERGIRPGRVYLWLHDVVAEQSVAAYRDRFHKVMVLSHYHRARYPGLPDELFFVTTNGIDPAHFTPPNPLRNPFRAVYGSEYSRGLRELLTSWPAIRRAVPTAELNVFYGWQGMDRRTPHHARRLRREFGPLLRQPGVTHLGRIAHNAVADQFRRAGVWAYPCWFRETSCITAMKAQAGGAIPAVIPAGALRETVRFGFSTAHSYDDLGGQDRAGLLAEWLQGLIGLLGNPEAQLAIRRDMVSASRGAFGWPRVAHTWIQEFGRP